MDVSGRNPIASMRRNSLPSVASLIEIDKEIRLLTGSPRETSMREGIGGELGRGEGMGAAIKTEMASL